MQAIDVHAHVGDYRGGRHGMLNRFCSGDAEYVIRRARSARIGLSVVSPLDALMPRGRADCLAGNRRGLSVVESHPELRLWAVLNPLQKDSYAQVREILQHKRCAGIKIHPELHGYPFSEHGMRIFEFAAVHGACILTHSGEANSRPADIVSAADAFPETPVILAHLGLGEDGDPTHQVRAVQAARHGNVYVDTSSANSVFSRIIEWAVAEIGSGKLLFGTDSPLYDAPMQRARIDGADIGDAKKRAILSGTALDLLFAGAEDVSHVRGAP